VEAGLAGSDPALLTRLMAQLIALLKAKASKRQQQLYSEWVPLQAYLALLQAHAQFATAGESVLDGDSRQVVQSAQEPHHRSDFLLAVPADFSLVMIGLCTRHTPMVAGINIHSCQG
jgi:hypothetical protein